MRPAQVVGLVVLGFVSGVAVGVVASDDDVSSEPPPPVEGAVTERVRHVTQTVPGDTSELERQLRECASQLRMQERVVADHEGAWQDWPEQFDPALDPDVFEEAAAALKLDGELESVDCAEFPCVATFDVDPEHVPFSASDPNVPLNYLNDLAQMLGAQMGIDGEVVVYPVQVHGDELETVITFGVVPTDHDTEALRERLHYRMKDQAETALCLNGACD